MAWVMARMCASVKVARSDDPRWPLVPKLTIWVGSRRSGLRSKYSVSSRATSTSISFGAGLPASGEIVTRPFDSPAIRLSAPLLRLHVSCGRAIGEHHSLVPADASGGNGGIAFEQTRQHRNLITAGHQP